MGEGAPEGGAPATALTRRRLLAAAGAGAGAFALSGVIETMRAAAQTLPPPALAPDDPAVRRTVEAIADTIVPGPAGGADRRPGAIEAGAVEELYEPFYGARSTFPAIHDDLLAATPAILGRPAAFELALPYADRERVLADRLTPPSEDGSSPLYVIYIGIGTLAYLSYYGTARSEVGPEVIRFPPESDGYWPRHSYRVRFRGMTRDGNPR